MINKYLRPFATERKRTRRVKKNAPLLKGHKKICQGGLYPAFRSTRQLYLSRAAGLGPSVSPRPGARPARPLPSPTGPAPAPRLPGDLLPQIYKNFSTLQIFLQGFFTFFHLVNPFTVRQRTVRPFTVRCVIVKGRTIFLDP